MNEDPLYREIILEHWQNPQNFGVVEPADFDASDANPLCGDNIRVTGRVQDGRLVEVAFTGEGCAVSRAAASLWTQEVKGTSVDGIRKRPAADVLSELGMELTPARTKCALLVYTTLQKALQ